MSHLALAPTGAQPADGPDAQAIINLHSAFERQRAAYRRDMSPTLAQRLALLRQLETLLVDNRQAIVEAINKDFGCHPAALTGLVEVMPTVLRARFARKHLKRWMRPQARAVNRVLFGLARNSVVAQPVGVVGNMSPWNFPFEIALGPLVDMLAAGNRVILKPSDITVHSSALIAELVSKYFDPEWVTVATGGVAMAEAFTKLPWDHLVYTGGPEIGRKVMRAAAEHLTPVTLELGGKCPTIFDVDAVTQNNVRDVMATKMIKSGQMCITPDYVLVPAQQLEVFIGMAQKAIQAMYPRQIDNPDTTSIISQRHFERLSGYLDEARAQGARTVSIDPHNEGADAARRKIPLTLVVNPAPTLSVARNEIFGPILLVLTYDSLDEALAHINQGERPLALYVFSKNKATIQRVMQGTISGAVCVNAAAAHGLQADLPFGGIGNSGMGHHHGHDGFLSFSKLKPVFRQGPVHGTAMLYPPYGATIERLLKFMLGK